MKVDMIALTGGPCAGKSSTTKDIEEQWRTKAIIAPEVASVLIEHLFPGPGGDFKLWIENLQKSIYPTQVSNENCYASIAEQSGLRTVICDRGTLDGAAYMPGGMKEFVNLLGLDPEAELARYSMVIHLESVATVSEQLWNDLKATNPARYETFEMAVEREMALRDIYKSHPNYHFISGHHGIEGVKSQVRSILGELLDTEIERKWVFDSVVYERLKNELRLDSFRVEPVRQGYITDVSDGAELRIREMGDQCFINVKGGSGLNRKEWERELPKAQFEALWPKTEGRRIYKSRYFIPIEGHTIEFDVFHEQHEGLVLFEVEFNSTREADSFVLPAPFHEARDVTEDKHYKNKSLAS